MADAARAHLIHIETDRRLGHEWDEWDGRPLANGGDFSAPPGLFFRYAALTMCVAFAALATLLYLLTPRLALVHAALPAALAWTIAAGFAVAILWFVILLLSFYGGVPLVPEGLLERGPYLRLMNLSSLVARAFRRRDWVEHAAIDVYNALAERRRRRVGKGELLVLIPRCLSKQALDGVLSIAGRYHVPGDPRAAAAGRRCGGVRARHDDGSAGRRGQASRARAHDAAPQRPLPRCPAGSRRDGSLGARPRGGVTHGVVFGDPNFSFNCASSFAASL